MLKRILVGLVPVLVIVAVAVAPSTALAVPHVYQNDSKLTEGEPLPIIMWGNLKPLNATTGEEECHYAVGGYLENPTGGGAAVGKIETFDAYSCVAEGCASDGGKIKVAAEILPWALDVGEESGVFRDEITGVNITYDCEGILSVLVHGEFKPKAKNGTSIGSKPSEAEFDEGSGELESELGPFRFGGKLSVEGYGKEQLVTVKNP